MSQQSEIFSRYRSLFNNSTSRPYENENSRRINNLSFVDFLFELVKSTKGQKQFKNIILKGSLSKLNKVDELNTIIKNSLIKQFGCDSTLTIPTKYTTKASIGIEIDKNEVDAFGLLGIDPNTKPGIYMYDGNDITKHTNYILNQAQKSNITNPIKVNFGERVLYEIYSNSPNTYIFKFGEYYENRLYSEWLSDYLTTITPIFNLVNFITILTDIITGAVSLKASKNKIEIRRESSLIKALQKIFGFCNELNDTGSPGDNNNDFLNNGLNNNVNYNGDGLTGSVNNLNGNNSNDPFDFNFDELDEINRNSDLKSRGLVRFSSCGDLELPINPDDILFELDLLFNSSNPNDLYSYDNFDVNELNNTAPTGVLYDNSLVTPNLDKSADFFEKSIKNGITSVINSGDDIRLDIPSINSEIQLNILKSIPYALNQMILSPKTLMVPKLYGVLSGDENKKTTNDFIRLLKPTISEIGNSVTNLLIENIFDSIKADLIRLANNIAVGYLKQRGIDYLLTLRSLLNLIGIFDRDTTSCDSVLNKLLKLLKLSNFGPMPALPPPLILISGALKPGLNSVSMINDLKSNLSEKGIETAVTLPDGTPNNLIIALEETMKVMVTHLKTNSNIQTFGISAVGPVQGYAQIQ